MHVFRHARLAALLFVFLASARSDAAQPSEFLLPTTTKSFVSVPDVDELRAKFDRTQLGQLVADPTMQPFVEDLKRQLKAKMNQTNARLGLVWSDLENVYAGEVALATIQPWDAEASQRIIEKAVETAARAKTAGKNERQIEALRVTTLADATAAQERLRRQQMATALLVDVTGKLDEASVLLGKIDKSFIERRATKATVEIGGVKTTVYTMPKERGQKTARQAFIVVHQDRLIATDQRGVTAGILARLDGKDAPSLAEVPAFSNAMTRCAAAFGETQPHVRWFIEPFGFVEVDRAYNGGRNRRGTDMLAVLANQGFTAIQGLGGYVTFYADDFEILHRTIVYAPPVQRGPNDDNPDKYDLAARMLDFPNDQPLSPHNWIPRGLGMFLSFNWKTQKAFAASETLVNEIAGDEVFRDVLDSIRDDPNGPQIDVEKELIAFLGERTTLISDYRLPINPKSERLLFALEVSNADAVMRTVNKAMESDPAAKKREFEGHVIWEILNEETREVEPLKIDAPGFGFGDVNEPAELVEEEKPLIPNSAVTVAFGHLLVASHVDYVVDILKKRPLTDQLERSADYQLVQAGLRRIGADVNSFNFFARTDEAYRVTYELTRQGRMPESESILGKLLNRMFEPEEEGVLRKQQIDGSKMPDYQIVRRYLGPAGFYVNTEADGWTVAGCLLSKDAE